MNPTWFPGTEGTHYAGRPLRTAPDLAAQLADALTLAEREDGDARDEDRGRTCGRGCGWCGGCS